MPCIFIPTATNSDFRTAPCKPMPRMSPHPPVTEEASLTERKIQEINPVETSCDNECLGTRPRRAILTKDRGI